MTIRDLKDAIEGLDEGMEVRIMSQDNWPFENTVANMLCASDIEEENEEEWDGEGDPPPYVNPGHYQPKPRRYSNEAPEDAFYLIEGHQLGYGTKEAWNR